jgi:transcriptional regulator with XRE-family HTH domain
MESEVPGRLIRRVREQAGLSQRELARRAGTSQPTVSAYERGQKSPSAVTLARLVRAAGAELTTRPAGDVRTWLRRTGRLREEPSGAFPAAAGRIREGEDPLFVLRELLDQLYLWEEVRGPDALAALVREVPPPTGNIRADALLAALAEHLVVTRGLARPAWVCEASRFLDHWWFPHRRRGFDALALRDAPAAFRRRGIMAHPSMLERR